LECQQKFNNSFFPESVIEKCNEKKTFEGNLGRKAWFSFESIDLEEGVLTYFLY
jgi:hypothetical protein